MAVDPGTNQGDDPISDSGYEEDAPESELEAELEVLNEDDS